LATTTRRSSWATLHSLMMQHGPTTRNWCSSGAPWVSDTLVFYRPSLPMLLIHIRKMFVHAQQDLLHAHLSQQSPP
jgi:hypothetical protein